MLKERINAGTVFVIGILSITIGIFSLCMPSAFVLATYFILAFVLMAIGLGDLIRFFIEHTSKKLYSGILKLLIGLFLIITPSSTIMKLPIYIGIYILINAIFSYINFYVYVTDDIKGKFWILIESIAYTIFAFLLFFFPLYQSKYVILIIGIFFILYGSIRIIDFFYIILKSNPKHHVHLTLPHLMNALLPKRLTEYINEIRRKEGTDATKLQPYIKPNRKYDMEILVHLGDKGFDSLGHVDLVFGDIVISYGCHDHHNTHLGGALGPGVIHICEKTNYLNFVINERQKSVIGFGVDLSESEKKTIKNTLLEMSSRFISWYSDYDLFQQGKPYQGDLKNYASLLSKYAKARFFKFRNGKYKTYFIMTNNCVLLADTIVGKSGIDLLKLRGVTTPGCYYEFLNDEFVLPNSKIVMRQIYTDTSITKLQVNQNIEKAITEMIDPTEFIKNNIFKGV